MSNRERWIIYPLLFFSLLLGLKEQLAIPIDAEYEHVQCNKLTVEAPDGRPLVELSSSIEAEGEQAGLLVLYGPINGDESALRSTVGMTATPRPRTVELGSDPGGGYFKSYGPAGAPTIKMGHDHTARTSGLVAVDDHGQLVASSDAAGDRDDWGLVIPWPPTPAESADSSVEPPVSSDASE
jgi:hypothetical protein